MPADGALSLITRRPDEPGQRMLGEAAERELAAVPLMTEAAVRFDCGRHNYAIVPAGELRRVGDGGAVIGVVFEHSATDPRYFLAEYLLANPASGERSDVIGVRPSGRLLHGGDLDVASGRIQLRSTPQRTFPPLAVEARLERGTGRLELARLVVEPDFSPRGVRPRRPAPVSPVKQ